MQTDVMSVNIAYLNFNSQYIEISLYQSLPDYSMLVPWENSSRVRPLRT